MSVAPGLWTVSAGHRTILPLQRQGEQLAGQVTRLTAGYRTVAAMWRAGPNAAAGPAGEGLYVVMTVP